MKHILFATCSIGSLMMAGAVHAQEQTSEQTEAARPSSSSDDIVVTARRIEESVQSTPVSSMS
ncbi:hypothetical protein [Novosphingobium sp. BL-52-GroH]|uniref:hypothetical protein n=1 Tax=Novosphingobium sp. BL-52-GroH TaxID=3349877 RepID=UPI00384B4A78